jgi:hypothetical protein
MPKKVKSPTHPWQRGPDQVPRTPEALASLSARVAAARLYEVTTRLLQGHHEVTTLSDLY